MHKLGLNKAIDQLAIASTMHCYVHVLNKVGHKKTTKIEVADQNEERKTKQDMEQRWRKNV